MEREIRLNSLLLKYGEDRFLNWCRSLTIFRFCKSHPYPDDLAPDRFIALIMFENRSALLSLLDRMKPIFLEKNLEEYLKLEEAKVFSGKAEINEVGCYISINEITGHLEIEVVGIDGDLFAITEDTFERTKLLDHFLEKLDLNFVLSPYDDDYCITPEFYPKVWT